MASRRAATIERASLPKTGRCLDEGSENLPTAIADWLGGMANKHRKMACSIRCTFLRCRFDGRCSLREFTRHSHKMHNRPRPRSAPPHLRLVHRNQMKQSASPIQRFPEAELDQGRSHVASGSARKRNGHIAARFWDRRFASSFSTGTMGMWH